MHSTTSRRADEDDTSQNGTQPQFGDGPPSNGGDDGPGAADPAPTGEQSSRLAGIAGVTVIEAASIYAWLWLHVAGHPVWGLGALILGETVETFFLRRFVDGGSAKRWRRLTDRRHIDKVRRKVEIAGIGEIAIWVLWLVCAERLGQEIAAGGLLVAMHLKHQFETAAIRDLAFRKGLLSLVALVGSALEVAGAVACLWFVLDDQLVVAAVALGLGLILEHALLIDVLHWEITARDIRLPRDIRWRSPKRPLPALAVHLASHYAPFWRLVDSIAPLRRLLNHRVINSRIARIEPRPNPLSTRSGYTSWASLTDRTYSGRHLPPVALEATLPEEDGPPSSAELMALFTRGKQMVPCPKTTVLFSFFAQWFTDGFLRTEREHRAKTDAEKAAQDAELARRGGKPKLRDTTRNESSHEIDLANLYGMTLAATDQLRGERGLLKCDRIDGGDEDYPPFLYHRVDGKVERKAEFDALPDPLAVDTLSDEQKLTLFAMGTDTRNIGFVAFNVLFLREHNRIATVLGRKHPTWSSDEIFERARNTVIVVLLKIVVEEYINHINPYEFKFRMIPGCFPNEPWHRPNWMAIEFNLLYRWHSLVPSTFHLRGKDLPIADLLSNTKVLTDVGLGELLSAASSQAAGRISLHNTDENLVLMAEKPSIEQARVARLASYNDYRRLSRYPPAASFAEISKNTEIQAELARLYNNRVEDVEFYVGLFAEDLEPRDVLPPLMLTMVAFDAFSQALTNPLLGPRVFNEDTFSATGMEIIKTTESLEQIVNRNVPERAAPYKVSFRRSEDARP